MITAGDRDDIVLGALSLHLTRGRDAVDVAGMLLTGGLTPHPSVMALLEQSDIPVATTTLDTFQTAYRVREHTYKIRATDREKIATVESLIREYVDIEAILSHT